MVIAVTPRTYRLDKLLKAIKLCTNLPPYILNKIQLFFGALCKFYDKST